MNHSSRFIPLLAALSLALSGPASALSNAFTYQGSLEDSGQAANGSYDLQFQLQTQNGVPVGATVLKDDVAVVQGVFSVDLDFNAPVTSGDFQLQIGVRAGTSTGSFTILSPTTRIAPTPQAQVAPGSCRTAGRWGPSPCSCGLQPRPGRQCGSGPCS